MEQNMSSKYRNLVIGCDGTWNNVGDEGISGNEEVNTTNVAKLLHAIFDDQYQVGHYEPGVGTAFRESVPGGMWGEGLDRQILGAYRFLRKRFSDDAFQRSQNKIFIFGFSRGSYAARRLAGLVSTCGITTAPDCDQEVWNAYNNQDYEKIRLLKESGKTFDVEIEMVGVWDTVKSTLDPDFDDHDLPEQIVAAYHAMSIDEKRKFFPVLKWNQDRRVKQTWFSGVHSDIGGGYNDTGLSDITFKWMVDNAYGHGLRVKEHPMEELNCNPECAPHDSYVGKWKALGEKVRTIHPTDRIHQSVQERLTSVAGYRPSNLPVDPTYIV